MSYTKKSSPPWKRGLASWVADSTNDLPKWLENQDTGLITGNIAIQNVSKWTSPTFLSRSS